METTKRRWGKPITQIQMFTPQEYCGSCIDKDGDITYTFKCGDEIAGKRTGLDEYLQGRDSHSSAVKVELLGKSQYGY